MEATVCAGGGEHNLYSAVHSEHGIRVALKTLLHVEPERLVRFKAEFRSVAGLSHPNLVPLYELGWQDDLWFFTMERVDGADFLTGLRGAVPAEAAEGSRTRPMGTTWTTVAVDRRRRGGRLVRYPAPTPPPSFQRVRAAILQLVRGVRALHEAGFLHLDLKPSNVLVEPGGSTHFVGREAEKESLRAAFRASQAAGGVVIHVTGPSGVGKSALLGSFVDEIADGGALVLTGRCYERETVPHKAFDGIVDDLAERLVTRVPEDVHRDLPPSIEELSRVFPVLATVPVIAARLDSVIGEDGEVASPLHGVHGVEDGDAGVASVVGLRRRAVQALCALLGKLAAAHPVVLRIDDLQWADADSTALLGSILDAAPPGLLVAASFRREEARANPALAPYFDLMRPGHGRLAAGLVSVDVAPLPAADTEALATATLRTLHVAPEGLARALSARAEESLAALRVFAEQGADNFAHRVALVEGEMARAGGDSGRAVRAFAEAAERAAASGFHGDVGLAEELAARCLAAEGATEEAARHAQVAREAYGRWGARAKVVRVG
jgi:hypothetical protein